MNVAVVGSRTWTDRAIVHRALDDINERWLGNYFPCEEYPNGKVGNDDMLVVSGGARGADTIAEEWAIVSFVHTLIHLPQWDRYGRRAGFIRNKLIVENADIVLAFHKDGSAGTRSSINLAIELGVPVIVWSK